LFLLLFPISNFAQIWEDHCKEATNDLINAQKKVSEVHKQLNTAETSAESAKFEYHQCKSSEPGNCEFERMELNSAIEEYNYYINELNESLSAFRNAASKINESCKESKLSPGKML
jgi:chromosome segregation ATPase